MILINKVQYIFRFITLLLKKYKVLTFNGSVTKFEIQLLNNLQDNLLLLDNFMIKNCRNTCLFE